MRIGLFTSYLCLLIFIVLLSPTRLKKYPINTQPNLVPFKNIIYVILFPPKHIDPGHWPNVFLNIVGNVLLFMPLSFFIRLFNPSKSNSRIIGLCFLSSFCIELSQLLFKIGEFDVDDMILNTAGAFLGLYFYKQITKFEARRIKKQLSVINNPDFL